ncbi:MAG: sugar phosphate isomerase/epimerase family protein [Armatimonadota bacterium]|nr:sugar phosphate isomerase/epimerase family protein [Armatimonadota bacterium]
MEIGILTSPFNGETLETVIAFAAKEGFDALEVDAGPGKTHLDPDKLTDQRAAEIKSLLKKNNIRISSLAQYTNMTDADPAKREQTCNNLIAAIDAAAKLDVPIVCAMAGMPVPGKTKMQTIEEDVAQVYPPILEHAAAKGVKIALENWYATNIQHLGHWQKIFEVLPQENFGLNFDPSHLLWQGIDYIEAVDRFAGRIFHTHAKDTEIKDHVLKWVGSQERGWWRYVIPGYGRVKWGEYIAALKSIGYDGILSIEHEDRAIGREAGFINGKNYLKLFI